VSPRDRHRAVELLRLRVPLQSVGVHSNEPGEFGDEFGLRAELVGAPERPTNRPEFSPQATVRDDDDAEHHLDRRPSERPPLLRCERLSTCHTG
jgi:hypothetical protein